MFGEKYSYDDEICQTMKKMNEDFLFACDPLNKGALIDLFPFLTNFKFILSDVQQTLRKTVKFMDEFVMGRINLAKVLLCIFNLLLVVCTFN